MFDIFSDPVLDDTGRVGFFAESAPGEAGLWIDEGGVLENLALSGAVAPGGGARFDTLWAQFEDGAQELFVTAAAVPLPASGLLLLTGLALMGGLPRRRFGASL